MVDLKFSHMERGIKVLWHGNHFDIMKTEKTQTENSNIQPLMFTGSTVDSIKMQEKFQLKLEMQIKEKYYFKIIQLAAKYIIKIIQML